MSKDKHSLKIDKDNEINDYIISFMPEYSEGGVCPIELESLLEVLNDKLKNLDYELQITGKIKIQFENSKENSKVELFYNSTIKIKKDKPTVEKIITS